jgi:hypothetical protein
VVDAFENLHRKVRVDGIVAGQFQESSRHDRGPSQ